MVVQRLFQTRISLFHKLCLDLSNRSCKINYHCCFFRLRINTSYRSLSSTNTDNQKYDEALRRSLHKPDEFWGELASKLIWTKKWDKVLDNSNPPFTKWFSGGELNICYNALDRHIDNGHGDDIALIHDSPVTNSIKKFTFKELHEQVSKFSGVLSKHGVKKGDCVLIYMPLIPENVITMLATARLGAMHCVVFGGFAAKELAVRINHAEPKIIVSASYGVEPTRKVEYKPILDEAIDLSSNKPEKCIIFNRPNFDPVLLNDIRDLNWENEMASAKTHDCVPIEANEPLYILHTSGTTGLPKAVVRPCGGYSVSLLWSMVNIYGIQPGEVWWAASDLGWVVGHSYICYGPLLNRNTSILYEGKPIGTPDAGAFFRVINDHNVTAAFTAPTAIRGIRREDPEAQIGSKYPMKSFKYFFVAGEHCDWETQQWAREKFRVPVFDHWWQTETGWPITATCVGLGENISPPKDVSGKPVPGYDVKIFNKDGTEIKAGDLGRIFVKLPLPPGTLTTLWKNDENFVNIYFKKMPGYYDTMDAGTFNKDGYVAVMSRADDVINVAGHRISAGALEEAMLGNHDLAECAVIGVEDELKGHVPLGICVLKKGVNKSSEDVIKEIIQVVRKNIGPIAAFKKAIIVDKLPKTRSGKIARSTITALAHSQPFKIPVTIEDPTVYEELKIALQSIGYAINAPDPN